MPKTENREIHTRSNGIQGTKCRWVGSGRVLEAIVADEIKSRSTLLPLGHFVMEAEACLLARIAETVEAIPGTIVCESSTDNCLAWSHKHRAKKMKKELLALKWPNGRDVLRIVLAHMPLGSRCQSSKQCTVRRRPAMRSCVCDVCEPPGPKLSCCCRSRGMLLQG